MKDSTKEDLILKSMMKARETELKLKAEEMKAEENTEASSTNEK